MSSISQDMKALTAEKERNSQNHSALADTLNKDLKSLDQGNRRIESQVVVGLGINEANESNENFNAQNVKNTQKANRQGAQRYRVRRQDVKFMRRGVKCDDNKSDAPLSVPSASW